MANAPDKERLQRLQEELLALKQRLPGAQLKKAAAGASPAAPFPISITADVAVPAEAERYDVEDVKVRAVLASGAAAPPAPRDQLAPAVMVEVLSPSLPAALRRAMSQQLHAAWLAGLPPQPASLQLAGVWEAAGRDFVRLISLLPQLLEAYEGVDAAGRTVRRFAILSDQASVQIDAGVAPAAGRAAAAAGAGPPRTSRPPAAAPAAAAAAAAAEEGSGVSSSSSSSVGAASSRKHHPPRQEEEGELVGLPAELAREVAVLRTRYGTALRLLNTQQQPAEGPPLAQHAAATAADTAAAAAAAAVAAAAAQRRMQQLTLNTSSGGGGASRAGTAAAAGCTAAPPLLELELTFRPTDPAWDPHSTLLLRCTLAPTYPAVDSLDVALTPQPPLPAIQHQVLQRLAASQLAAGAAPGRPGALRAAVRYLENHAGELLRDAEDLALEVMQRRRAAAAAGVSAAAGAAAVEVGGTATERSSGGGARASVDSQRSHGTAALASPGPQSLQRHSAGGSDSDGFWYSGDEESEGSEGDGGGHEASASGSDSTGSTGSWDWEEGEEEAAGEDAGGDRTGGLGHSEAGLRGGLQLQLEGLSLVDCNVLEILRLNLQVGCSRCQRASDVTFATPAVALPSSSPTPASAAGAARSAPAQHSGGLEWGGECSHCHSPMLVQLVPRMVHDRSNVLAVIRAEGCTPMDLLPSMLAGQCGRCGAAAAFRSVQVAVPTERTCSSCHSKIGFQFSNALFVAAMPPAGGARSGRQRDSAAGGGAAHNAGGQGGATAAFQGLLTPGQPLPALGTCKHYHHSHRWLRFPCCGRRFPCDLCHEELTDGHDMRWATRMVCGYCSREQAMAERCQHCDKKLAGRAAAPSGRNTRFWEGGEGCRDARFMTRKEPRKYKGRGGKTQSRKALRVGERGAGRRDERAAAAARQ